MEASYLANAAENWLIKAPGGIDRIEACFTGVAFALHRHDTYAIGMTLKGVQSFSYRGAARHSRPGQMVILHPDEAHDGRAGDEESFQYRTAYIPPAHIQTVLGGRSLPFIDGGVSGDPRLRQAIQTLLADYDHPMTALEQQDALFDLTMALQAVSGGATVIRRVNREAALSARDYVEACLDRSFSLDELEGASRHDRWQLSRDFRQMFGTSPYRYLILRRLDKARGMLLGGSTIAQAAYGCGFGDQSHFGRLFKKSFGMTPNAWLRAMRPAHDHSIPAAGIAPN